jgi:hypothetical protein
MFSDGLGYYNTRVIAELRGTQGASAFNQPLTLDTSSVTAMGGMFQGASAFNQPLTLFQSARKRERCVHSLSGSAPTVV